MDIHLAVELVQTLVVGSVIVVVSVLVYKAVVAVRGAK